MAWKWWRNQFLALLLAVFDTRKLNTSINHLLLWLCAASLLEATFGVLAKSLILGNSNLSPCHYVDRCSIVRVTCRTLQAFGCFTSLRKYKIHQTPYLASKSVFWSSKSKIGGVISNVITKPQITGVCRSLLTVPFFFAFTSQVFLSFSTCVYLDGVCHRHQDLSTTMFNILRLKLHHYQLMLTMISLYRLYLVVCSIRGQPQPSRATKTKVGKTNYLSISKNIRIRISISAESVKAGNSGNPSSSTVGGAFWSLLCCLVSTAPVVLTGPQDRTVLWRRESLGGQN